MQFLSTTICSKAYRVKQISTLLFTPLVDIKTFFIYIWLPTAKWQLRITRPNLDTTFNLYWNRDKNEKLWIKNHYLKIGNEKYKESQWESYSGPSRWQLVSLLHGHATMRNPLQFTMLYIVANTLSKRYQFCWLNITFIYNKNYQFSQI